MILCDKCGNRYPGYYIINTSNETEGYEQLCFECFNKIMADQLGIKLIELRKKSFTMDDIDGKKHLFKIIRKVYPQGIILEAIEIQDGKAKGYVIAVDDNIDSNQQELEIKLYKKVKDELYNKYIESKNAFGDEHLIIKDAKVIGRLDYDETTSGRIPLVVIDGQEYTWEQFGRLLKSYEGWQFKMELFDITDDIS